MLSDKRVRGFLSAIPRVGRGGIVFVGLLGATMSSYAMAIAAGASAGIHAGEKIPGFKATDQNGREQTFRTLAGRNGLVLLFFRSADW